MSNEIGSTLTVTVPTVGVTAGPTWATDVNGCLTALITAVETGVRTSLGLLVDSDVDLESHGLANATSLSLTDNTVPLSGLATLYRSGDDLWFTDAQGRQVKITAGGAINAAGLVGILGDYGGSNPAAVTYVDATKTFVFTQDVGESADIDVGNVKLRESGVAGANAVTLSSPSSLAASYTLKMPAALPASTSLATVDSSGNVALTRTPSITSLTTSGAVTSGSLSTGGITCTSIIGSGTFLTTGDISADDISGNTLTTAEGNVRHGTKRILLAPPSGVLTVSPASVTNTGGTIANTGTNFALFFDLPTPSVGTLTKVLIRVLSTSGAKPTLKLWSIAALTGARTQVGSTQTAAGTSEEDLSIGSLSSSITSSTRYVLEVAINASGQACLPGYYEYTNP